MHSMDVNQFDCWAAGPKGKTRLLAQYPINRGVMRLIRVIDSSTIGLGMRSDRSSSGIYIKIINKGA